MGIGFVILIHLIAIFILSIAVAVIASIIVYFVSKKERKKRKILLAFIAPFVGFYTLYICATIGSIVVSEAKNIDVGIGDAWYVPLENNSELLFIDIPEQASIRKNLTGESVISEISHIEQNGNRVFGKTYDNTYFSYDTKTDELKNFATEKELTASNSGKKIILKDAYDFYAEKRNEIAGVWLIVIGILSLIISIGVVYLLKEIIYYFGFRGSVKN
ncbi:MAG: hypothetical protein QM564_04590 [Bergeyella sp.]